MSFLSWNLFTLGGCGAKFRPLDSRLVSSGDSSTSEMFTTVRGEGLSLHGGEGGSSDVRWKRLLVLALLFLRLVIFLSFSCPDVVSVS